MLTVVPHLVFASPRSLPKTTRLEGRVVVLDIAFAATVGASVSFDSITLPFIQTLGDRLAAWVDHHDHDRHCDYLDDPRFFLATKAQHGGCPEMISEDIVRLAGPVDTIVCHLDLDGLYAAAKWMLGGVEPYRGADIDARCVDTRVGVPGPKARLIDRALRARFRDANLKRAVVMWLVEGLDVYKTTIDSAAEEFAVRDEGTRYWSERFAKRGRVAVVQIQPGSDPYDKTDLLLRGQQDAEVAIVQDSGMVTIAAKYDSGWDFVRLLRLGGGMPTRVTVPESRLDEAILAINTAPEPKSSSATE